MISSQFLIIFGALTAALCILAVIRCRREFIPTHWLFFVSYALVALGIALFYYEVSYGIVGSLISRVTLSRILWSYILLSISLKSIGVLVYRK